MNQAKHSKLMIAILICLFSLSASAIPPVIGNVPIASNVNIPQHIPGNPNHLPEVLISRQDYLLSFNQHTRLLNWAAWKLEPSDIGHIGRSNNFQPDLDLQNYLALFHQNAVTPDDYLNSCFDRGHQVPSADRDTNVDLNVQTFIMSNMIPQTAYLNRVRWEHLEEYSRNLVTNESKKLYTIAGPIYDENFGMIGPHLDIPVPSKNFKVIIVLEKNQTLADINRNTRIIAVIMPNRLSNGKKPLDDKTALCDEAGHVGNPNQSPSGTTGPRQWVPLTPEQLVDWTPYQVPLSEVERLSGFTLAPQLRP